MMIFTRMAYAGFDAHHDCWDDSDREDNQTLWCGGFVRSIRRDCAAQVLTVGTQNSPYREVGRFTQQEHMPVLLKEKLMDFPNDVYLSFDLDVLDPAIMLTDWPDGIMQIESLINCIDEIKKAKRIIGADILGFSGDKMRKEMQNVYQRSLQVYREIVSALLR